MSIKLKSFTAAFGPLFYDWYESGKYPVFFRALDGFYSQEMFAQLTTILQSHLYLVENDGKPIGSVIVHNWQRTSRVCSAGIMLIEEEQNQGNCVKVMMEVGKILFDDHAVQKVSFDCLKSDQKIAHLFEKFGVKKEGEFEREAFINGKYETTVSYAFFVEDWEAIKCQRKSE